MVYKIDLGSYIVDSTQVDLYLNITIDNDKITLEVPFPSGYPSTPLRLSILEGRISPVYRGIFYSELNVISNEWSWRRTAWDNTRDILEIEGYDGISIDMLYLIPKTASRLIRLTRDDELDMLRGLGRRCLCKAISFIVKHYEFDIDDTIIILEAAGGAVRDQEDIQRVELYTELQRHELVDAITNSYSPMQSTHNLQTWPASVLAELLVSLENNARLVRYYSNAYGFTRLSTSNSISIPMGTTAASFIYSCSRETL